MLDWFLSSHHFFTHFSADDMAEEKAVIWTTHTHRVPAPSFFLQNQNDDPVTSTYFEQRVPVPEENSEVIPQSSKENVCM